MRGRRDNEGREKVRIADESPVVGQPSSILGRSSQLQDCRPHARNRAGGKLAIPKWVRLSNSDLSSHAINQLLGIVADPSLKHRLDVLDLVNSF